MEETGLAALGNLLAGPFVDYTRRSRNLEQRTNQNLVEQCNQSSGVQGSSPGSEPVLQLRLFSKLHILSLLLLRFFFVF